MKRLCLSIAMLSVVLAVSAPAIAQRTFTGKPKYNIRTTQKGKDIGNIVIELFPNISPLTVRNFDSLVSIQFFDRTAFHRVVPNFVIQGGDPNSRDGDPSTWGQGDGDQTTIPAEFGAVSHQRGILSMARLGTDTNSQTSQFFICISPQWKLDHQYSSFGQVLSGMSFVDLIDSVPRNASDQPNDKIEMFITPLEEDMSVPGVATLQSPPDGATGVVVGQTLAWDMVPGAMMYEVQFASDKDFTAIIGRHEVNQLHGADTLRGLLGARSVWWRVRANNGGKWGAYSAARSFMFDGALTILSAPPDGSKTSNLHPTFHWIAAVGATSYHLQVATSAGFSKAKTILDKDLIAADSFQTTTASLNPNLKYYWRVIPNIGATPGASSAIFTLTTAAASVDASAEASGAIMVYPNPTTEVATLRYTLASPTKVTLTLLDALGRVIISPVTAVTQTEGVHEIPISLKGKPSGEYYYRLQTGTEVYTGHLMLE